MTPLSSALSSSDNLESIPVVILCGGRGILVDESGRRFNKALVRIKNEPMVAHVMRGYAAAGFRRFVLTAGRQADELEATLVTEYGGRPVAAEPGVYALTLDGIACTFRVVDTGEAAATGERLRAVRSCLGDPAVFAVTYSDTLCDVDLRAMLAVHRRHGRLATMLATQMPTRFRILGLRPGDPLVRGFLEKALVENDPINGGFYFFQGAALSERYLGNPAPGLVLETTVLEQLVEDRQLVSHAHGGAWHYLDSERDIPAVTAVAEVMLRPAGKG